MSHAVGTGGSLVYMPAGGLGGQPYGTLFGRPVIPIEQAATLGDLGDIIFADLSGGYILAEKGGIKADMSIYTRFEYDESVFRSTKQAALDSNVEMNSSLIRGSLNSKEQGNPEPSRGFMPWACVETIQEPAYFN